MNAILKTAAGNPENQDRGAVIDSGTGAVLVVADGAGGLSGGIEAAVMAVEIVRQSLNQLAGAAACAALLRAIDQQILLNENSGETTCAVVVTTEGRIFGASVGDSGVWLIGTAAVVDLTHRQSRKPLLGSGSARPVEFTQQTRKGEILLLATDGLLKYASAERIATVCRESDNEVCATRLIELVRYPSGTLPDDVTLIVAGL
jgi:serine/threonine protein phosphatase PrpC